MVIGPHRRAAPRKCAGRLLTIVSQDWVRATLTEPAPGFGRSTTRQQQGHRFALLVRSLHLRRDAGRFHEDGQDQIQVEDDLPGVWGRRYPRGSTMSGRLKLCDNMFLSLDGRKPHNSCLDIDVHQPERRGRPALG